MPDGQFYWAMLWYHLMAPFYGMYVPGLMLGLAPLDFKVAPSFV